MHKYPANHPVWKLLSHTVYLSFATLFLWINASSFDSTELITIAEIAGAAGGIEFIKAKLSKG
jgi:hypothetical protein|tara:strand:- start:1042 stop:1230 length:189 start_codon:yes stop_codon:yes gene_type:complete